GGVDQAEVLFGANIHPVKLAEREIAGFPVADRFVTEEVRCVKTSGSRAGFGRVTTAPEDIRIGQGGTPIKIIRWKTRAVHPGLFERQPLSIHDAALATQPFNSSAESLPASAGRLSQDDARHAQDSTAPEAEETEPES